MLRSNSSKRISYGGSNFVKPVDLKIIAIQNKDVANRPEYPVTQSPYDENREQSIAALARLIIQRILVFH